MHFDEEKPNLMIRLLLKMKSLLFYNQYLDFGIV